MKRVLKNRLQALLTLLKQCGLDSDRRGGKSLLDKHVGGDKAP